MKYIGDYDSLGRLSKEEVQNSSDSSFIGSAEYGYDVRNNLTKLATTYGGLAINQRYYYSEVEQNTSSASYEKDNLPTMYMLYSGRYATYEYDAWGNVIAVNDASGNAITDETHIALVNPIRYRGYYYDSETELYYLQSRYYNAEIGRFLNADSLLPDIGVDVLGNNTFSYCLNNPVNMSDPTGHWPSWSKLFSGASLALGGMSAIAAVAVGALACVNPVVLGAIVVAGAVSVAMHNAISGKGHSREDIIDEAFYLFPELEG